MKKTFLAVTLVAMAYSSYATADYFYEGHQHHRHHHSHGYPGQRFYREEVIVYPAPQVQYYTPPPVVYYPPQQPVYVAPVQRPHHYNRPSRQGLVGGVVGGALGYQMGQGDPVATGLGAAAGAFVGNRW